MENIMADKENFSTSMDIDYYLPNEGTLEGNCEDNSVADLKVLAENTLADLIAKKAALEETLKAKFETRLKLQKEADVRRNHAFALRQQTDEVETENIKLLQKLETLKAECAELKQQRANVPMLAYQEQYGYVVSQLSNLERVVAMFSKFKSKEAIENAFKTLTIQIEQIKKKCCEEEQNLAELQNKIEGLKKQIRSHPTNVLEVISAALKRDLLDAEAELSMQRK